MRHLRPLMTFVFLGAMIIMMSGTSAADVMIYASTTAPTIGPNENPVTLLNGDTGTTVHGSLTGPNAGILFTTTNDILFNGAVNGTPALRAEDGSINNLVISLPGFNFTDAIFDVYGVYAVHPSLTVSVYLSDGAVAQTFQLQAGQTSRDWITVQAFAGETISSIVITDAKFYALESTNISGDVSNTPEPATFALVCSGLIGIGTKLRKYNRGARGTKPNGASL